MAESYRRRSAAAREESEIDSLPFVGKRCFYLISKFGYLRF